MKNLKLFLLIQCLWNLPGFSQKIILNNSGDTAICFSLNQGRFLLNKIYKVQESDTLLSIYKIQISNFAKVIKMDSLSIIYLKSMHKNDSSIIISCEFQKIILQSDKILLTSKIKKEKRLKWVFMGLSGFLLFYMFLH